MAGRFNLSELLFIPPEDLAGPMDATLSIKTQQGDVIQETPTEASFKVETSAVADAPTLKDANGNVIDPTVQDYTPPTIEITGIEDEVNVINDKNVPGIDLSNKISSLATGGDKVGAFIVYFTHSGNVFPRITLLGESLSR